MKTTPSAHKISFKKLIRLFKRRSDRNLVLESRIGQGSVQIFDLEKGLQARIWDCSFHQGLEMYNDIASDVGAGYFTLAFFPDRKGLQFANSDTYLHENSARDTVFASSSSDYRMYLSPMARGHCLSINFSKKWLSNNVLEGSDAFRKLNERINTVRSFLLVESMTQSEKNIIRELHEASWKKSFGSFYIKSVVLRIISDFFYKIKDNETLNTHSSLLETAITDIEKYLNMNVTGKLPNLKDLACQHFISESTMKRHFKNKHGINISTYFLNRKIEYAQQLMNKGEMNISKVASMLGYRSVNHFKAIFKKYCNASHCDPALKI